MLQLTLEITFKHWQHERYNKKRQSLRLIFGLVNSFKKRAKKKLDEALTQLKLVFDVLSVDSKKLLKPLKKEFGSNVVELVRRGFIGSTGLMVDFGTCSGRSESPVFYLRYKELIEAIKKKAS